MAAIDGAVWMDPYQFRSHRSPKCTIVHCETTPKFSAAPFAEVADGHMVIEGYLRGGDYTVAESKDNYGQHMARVLWDRDTLQVPNQLSPPAEATMTEYPWNIHLDTLQEPFHGHAYFLIIMSYYVKAGKDPNDPCPRERAGLVLKRLSGHTYRRLGTSETRRRHESDIGDPPWCRITIV